MSNLAKQGLGKILFNQLLGYLTDNPESELKQFSKFIREEASKVKELVHLSSLKTEILLEPTKGLEPLTCALRVRCSTTELRRLFFKYLFDIKYRPSNSTT